MKIFQKLAAVLSISMLAAIGAQSVQAAEQVNGISMNGSKVNGLTYNGIKRNGLRCNGMTFNGGKLNGTSLDGRLSQTGQVFAVTLPVSIAP